MKKQNNSYHVLTLLLFLITSPLLSCAGKDTSNINLSAGAPYGLNIGYGYEHDNISFNICAALPLTRCGLKTNLVYRIFSALNTNHSFGVNAGIIYAEQLESKAFLNYIAGDANRVARGFITSFYGGITYQIEYSNIFLQTEALIGTGNFRKGRLGYLLGYLFYL